MDQGQSDLPAPRPRDWLPSALCHRVAGPYVRGPVPTVCVGLPALLWPSHDGGIPHPHRAAIQ